ncbi:MAG: phosphopyruvate hydratase, partial [Solirubrobacterales bacterium]|nr:phosphopyruvate hydratase [Solirubrobacterales bacterium]
MTLVSPVITAVAAREVLDCRGLPTLQVDLTLDEAVTGTADVPTGRSTGANEAFELRDGGSRFGGFGVLKAAGNVTGEIAEALLGTELTDQRSLDQLLIELDGTEDKSRLGANAILGVSLAAARASAEYHGVPLYRAISSNAHLLPVPLVNLINGGKHASNDLDFQEFIVLPVGAESMLEALQISSEVNLALADILLERYGKVALNTGDEGGFAPPISDPHEALGLLHEAVEAAGYTGRFRYGLDAASTHYYDKDKGTYLVNWGERDRDGMIELYKELIEKYDIVTIEDPLDEEDFEGFAKLTEESGIQIVGDDLFTTNPKRLAQGIEIGAANSLLWKFNQIGTLSEALDAAEMAHKAGYTVVVSERSGETEDPIISDFTVALGAGQIKTGAPV